jgi:hypothetical protein
MSVRIGVVDAGEAVDVGGEWLAEVSVGVDGPWVGLGAVEMLARYRSRRFNVESIDFSSREMS